jgi:hypothetical protein
MVLVCAPGHRLAGLESVAFEDLAGAKVIGFDSDLTIRREIDRVLALHDAEVRVTMEFDNIETIKRAVEIDAGVALLPEPTVLREVEAKTLAMVPLASDELVRPLGIIHRRGKELASTTRRFIELLRSTDQDTLLASHSGAQLNEASTAGGRLHHGNGRDSENGRASSHGRGGGQDEARAQLKPELQVFAGSQGERPRPVAAK